MSATVVALTSAVEVGKFLYQNATYQCEVIIENQTDSLLIHQAYYSGHGRVCVLTALPAVPPRFCTGDTEYIFDEAVALANDSPAVAPPAVVMVWKFADRDLWLVVFAYMAGPLGTSAAYYAISTSHVEPADFWANATKNTTWFYVGDVKEHCDTGGHTGRPAVGGISLTGFANDENPMQLKVTLSM
jgi:hypothetical protein